MGSLHAAGQDVGKPIAVDIGHDDLTSDSRICVGEKRDELYTFVTSHEFEPIDDCAGVPHRTFRVVRPVRLARDDILESVAVDVGQLHTMEFRKENTIRIVRPFLAHDEVAVEGDFSRFIAYLFEPG